MLASAGVLAVAVLAPAPDSQPIVSVEDSGPVSPSDPSPVELAPAGEDSVESPTEPTSAEGPDPSVEPPVRIDRPRRDDELSIDLVDRAEQRMLDGDLEGSLYDLRGHVHDNPRTPDLLIRIGGLARQLGDRRLARAALEEGLQQDPERVDALLELARLELSAGRHAQAEATAMRAAQIFPEDGVAWNLMGRAAMAQSEWERAQLHLERAVELSPTQGLYFNNLGLLHIYRRRGEPAVRALRAAVELLGPKTPPFVFNNLGLAYELRGELGLARSTFEDARRADPSYVKAQLNLRRVDAALERAALAAAVSTRETEAAAEREAEAEPVESAPMGLIP